MLTFKVGALARQLGVHRNTITNWIKKGTFPAKPTAAKRYTMAKKRFIRFCKQENIPYDVMINILEKASKSKQGIRPAFLSEQEDMPGFAKQEEPAASDGLTETCPSMSRAVGAVMVVGGGIAGIQTALDLAHGGYYVYLIEKKSGIGSTLAQLYKIFSTNDCDSCILLPEQVKCIADQNIELIALAQVQSVQGEAGDFFISVKKYPRYIDTDKCIACGVCAEKCPVHVADTFNGHIRKRKAIDIKYDHWAPQKYAIDSAACLYFTHGKCRACEKFCPTGAIDFGRVEETVTLNVGAVVLAPEFKPFDPSSHGVYGYGKIKDVVTSLEYECLLGVNGPFGGKLVRPSDCTRPRKIAWVQCVGSRNQNGCGNAYCSSICCMMAVKQALASQELFLDHRMDRAIFFLDLRTHGKESERFFERAKNDMVRFVRAFPHSVEPGTDGTGVTIRYIDEKGDMHHEHFDMVVLSTGVEPPWETKRLARIFKVELDEHQFAITPCFNPLETSIKGVYAIGAYQTPKSIARSVTQASAVAASVATLLMEARGSLTKVLVSSMERKEVIPKVLVVGGGMVGMRCALTLAHLGVRITLIECWEHLGGNALSLSICDKDQPSVLSILDEVIASVLDHPNIRIYHNATLVSVSGSVGNFRGVLQVNGKKKKIGFGAAVMAVGAKEAVPREYLYGTDPRVMTQLEFGHRVLADVTTVGRARHIVFIQCVGSREPKRPYCSRVCCIHSVKTAIYLKKLNSNIKISVLYRDMRTYGEWEACYTDARALGVMFIRYEVDQKPRVRQKGETLSVLVFDTVLQRPVNISADYLVLASGVDAHGNKNPADLFKVDVSSDGFFNGAHPKLRPVDLSVAGLFMAGLCNYPKPMDESIEEAQAAAYRAFVMLSRGEIVSNPFMKDEYQSPSMDQEISETITGDALMPLDLDAQTGVPLLRDYFREIAPDSGQPDICLQCGACASGCPMSGVFDMNPRKFVRMVSMGLDNELLNNQWVWSCSLCNRCVPVCPMNIHIPRLVFLVRTHWDTHLPL